MFSHVIGECFSKVKKVLANNSIAYQSTDSPQLLVTAAFTTVTKENCLGYIQHADYCGSAVLAGICSELGEHFESASCTQTVPCTYDSEVVSTQPYASI